MDRDSYIDSCEFIFILIRAKDYESIASAKEGDTIGFELLNAAFSENQPTESEIAQLPRFFEIDEKIKELGQGVALVQVVEPALMALVREKVKAASEDEVRVVRPEGHVLH